MSIRKPIWNTYPSTHLPDEDDDGDNQAAARQLTRAQEKWGRLSRVLTSEGTTGSAQICGYFYMAIVQAVLLYGSETWTLSESMLKQVESFHRRIARYLIGRHIRQFKDGTWHYPSSDGVLREAILFIIKEYIRRRRRTVGNFVEERPMLEACKQSTALSTNVNKVA